MITLLISNLKTFVIIDYCHVQNMWVCVVVRCGERRTFVMPSFLISSFKTLEYWNQFTTNTFIIENTERCLNPHFDVWKRLECIITAINPQTWEQYGTKTEEMVCGKKKAGWWREAVRTAALWTWSETSFKQRTKAANPEKKALPVSAKNKEFEEDETFGTASVQVEQLKPMNIDERLMCK